ncbi:thiamine-phosphate kinase [Arthrobacter gandavensis]|uniref:thiamine-phosphate kinase n=1 Tax=Arthrobacter gandavensis TaxID=169960 RepID=UPI00188E921E|nr:thiamine-phosphate kinase [Arthrobacter gandavensis]MBF4995524.1 thiamine-phosphate kinase [Arthrobacter gandavensis]
MEDFPQTVAGLGEGELLSRIFPRLGGPRMPLGPGDDAAVVAAPDGRSVLSIDTLVQDQDFRLHWAGGYRSTGYDVGWKCAAQNLSDINAMGAVASSLVVSLTLPDETPVSWVEGLADGLSAALRALGAEDCAVAGGDLGRGDQLVVTAAVTGDLQGRDPVRRSGAVPGDVLALCGALGQAAAGLALLDSSAPYTDLGGRERALTAAQSRPCPPLASGPAAAAAGAHAMMDVSDGLVRDAGRLGKASGVRIDLDPEILRAEAESLADTAARLGANPLSWVLGGGEDHGLLAAFGPEQDLPHGFRIVGTVLAPKEGVSGVTVGGAEPAVLGWDHFGG